MRCHLAVSISALLFAMGALSLAGPALHAQYMGPAVASPAAGANAPEFATHVSYAENRLAPGDVIAIATYGVPELTTTSQTSTGSLVLPSSSAVLEGIKVGSNWNWRKQEFLWTLK